MAGLFFSDIAVATNNRLTELIHAAVSPQPQAAGTVSDFSNVRCHASLGRTSTNVERSYVKHVAGMLVRERWK